MKKIEMDGSSLALFFVLLLFLMVLAVFVGTVLGTVAMNYLLVVFAVPIPPLSLLEGLTVIGASWLLSMIIRPPFRRNK